MVLLLLPLVGEQFDGLVAEMVEPPGDVGAVLHLLDEEGLLHAGLVARLDAADDGFFMASPRVVVSFLVVLLSAFVSKWLDEDYIFTFFLVFISIASLIFISIASFGFAVGFVFIILLRERAELQMSANKFGRRIAGEHFMEMILAFDEQTTPRRSRIILICAFGFDVFGNRLGSARLFERSFDFLNFLNASRAAAATSLFMMIIALSMRFITMMMMFMTMRLMMMLLLRLMMFMMMFIALLVDLDC